MPTGKSKLYAIAGSKLAAAKAAGQLSNEELAVVISNLQAVVESRRKIDRERDRKLRRLNKMISELGLTAEDLKLLGTTTDEGQRGNRKKQENRLSKSSKVVPPKYRLKEGRETHQWTGRGRMPLVFKSYLAKGGSLEKCLIK